MPEGFGGSALHQWVLNQQNALGFKPAGGQYTAAERGIFTAVTRLILQDQAIGRQVKTLHRRIRQ
ncbi:hypothetical protein D3C71_2194810 [compost metagenome]